MSLCQNHPEPSRRQHLPEFVLKKARDLVESLPDVLQSFQVQALISYLDHEPTPMIVMNTEYEILAANTAYKRQFATAGRV